MSDRYSRRQQAMGVRPAVVVVLLGAIFAAGCTTFTRINSTPPGADVFVNSSFLGKTPATWPGRNGFPSEAVWVMISKPGFKPQTVQMKKSFRADESLLLLIPGIFPYVCSARFKDQQNFVLEPEK